MTINESLNCLKIGVERAQTLLNLFLTGQIGVDNFEDQYRSIMNDMNEVTSGEYETPNDNGSYVLNDSTVIKNKTQREDDAYQAKRDSALLAIDPDLYNVDKW